MSESANYVGPPRLINLSCEVKPPEAGKQAHCILNLEIENESNMSSSSEPGKQVKLELSKSSLEAVISSLEKVKAHFDAIAGHQAAKSE